MKTKKQYVSQKTFNKILAYLATDALVLFADKQHKKGKIENPVSFWDFFDYCGGLARENKFSSEHVIKAIEKDSADPEVFLFVINAHTDFTKKSLVSALNTYIVDKEL